MHKNKNGGEERKEEDEKIYPTRTSIDMFQRSLSGSRISMLKLEDH